MSAPPASTPGPPSGEAATPKGRTTTWIAVIAGVLGLAALGFGIASIVRSIPSLAPPAQTAGPDGSLRADVEAGESWVIAVRTTPGTAASYGDLSVVEARVADAAAGGTSVTFEESANLTWSTPSSETVALFSATVPTDGTLVVRVDGDVRTGELVLLRNALAEAFLYLGVGIVLVVMSMLLIGLTVILAIVAILSKRSAAASGPA